MNNCKDCRHCVTSTSPLTDNEFEYAKCMAPKNLIMDRVSGEMTLRWSFCSTHRDDVWPVAILHRTCGKRGRWFEKIQN